jgi:hypothetical protein
VSRSILRSGATVLLAAAVGAGCARSDNIIKHQQQKLESLGATAQMVGEAWLGGSVSTTYAQTALEQTQTQVEQQRTILASKPATLQDPRGSDLSQRGERLSRLVAQLIGDVAASNTDTLRRHLSQIPIIPQDR